MRFDFDFRPNTRIPEGLTHGFMRRKGERAERGKGGKGKGLKGGGDEKKDGKRVGEREMLCIFAL